MEVYALGLVIIAGLIWLALRLSKNSGKVEAENIGKQQTLDIIKHNKKIAWRNEKYIGGLNDDELAKLREEYSRK